MPEFDAGTFGNKEWTITHENLDKYRSLSLHKVILEIALTSSHTEPR